MLVGREAELSLTTETISRAAEGRGALVVLTGEAGIGKTRLADELADRAAASGFAVHWGRALETGGAPPYWPWSQIFEDLRHEAGSEPLPAPVAGVLDGSTTDLHDARASDPTQQRFALFAATMGVLRRAAERRPRLLILDDAHAADVASVELLRFVARSLRGTRIAIVVTHREIEARLAPVSEGLAALSREGRSISLRRLPLQDVQRLVSELLGRDAGLSQALFERSDGNPLFVQELIRKVAAAGIERLEDPADAGGGIQAVLAERIRRLPDDARGLAEVASVIGRSGPKDLLRVSSDSPLEAFERSFAALESLGVVTRQGPERWSFSHVLLRDALYAGIPPEHRRRLHDAVARALAPGADRGSDLASRLHHALAALPIGGTHRAAELAVLASGRARASAAFEEAVEQLQAALAACDRAGQEPADRAELLVALGWACVDAGRMRGAREAFDGAAAIARAQSAPELLARAALGRGAEYVLGEVRSELLGLLREALDATGDRDAALRARLVARLAAALTPSATPEEPIGLARDALALLSPSTDPRAELDVTVSAGSALADFADPTERVAVNERLVARARDFDDRVLELRGLSRLVTDHLESGDVARADAVLAARDEVARRLALPRYAWQSPLFRSMRAMIEGRFADCEAAILEASAVGERAEDPNVERCIAVHRFWLLLLAGRSDELVAHEPAVLKVFDRMSGSHEHVAMASAAVRARRGEIERARASIASVADAGLGHIGACMGTTTFAEAAVEARATERLAVLYERLAPSKSRNATWGLFGLACYVPVSGVLGSIASALGRHAEADACFAHASERARAMRAPAHEAWIELWRGQAWADRAEPSRAEPHLERAMELAAELGMPDVERRARSAFERDRPAGPPSVRSERVPASAASRDSEIAFGLTREGDAWRVTHGARSFAVKDVRGMAMLATLVERPDQELHALALAGDPDAAATGRGDAGELIDDKAKAAYQRRVRDLREELEEAESTGRAEHAERIREEIEALSRELSRALGLGGRHRRAGSDAERARITVQRRVREAIKRIADLDPDLGRHLDWTIRTGTFCAYEPKGRRRT